MLDTWFLLAEQAYRIGGTPLVAVIDQIQASKLSIILARLVIAFYETEKAEQDKASEERAAKQDVLDYQRGDY